MLSAPESKIPFAVPVVKEVSVVVDVQAAVVQLTIAITGATVQLFDPDRFAVNLSITLPSPLQKTGPTGVPVVIVPPAGICHAGYARGTCVMVFVPVSFNAGIVAEPWTSKLGPFPTAGAWIVTDGSLVVPVVKLESASIASSPIRKEI